MSGGNSKFVCERAARQEPLCGSFILCFPPDTCNSCKCALKTGSSYTLQSTGTTLIGDDCATAWTSYPDGPTPTIYQYENFGRATVGPLNPPTT